MKVTLLGDLVGDVPTYHQYHDTGCEFSKSCLECGLPQCKYDSPGYGQSVRISNRAKRIAELHGLTNHQIAFILGINIRTVQRYL